MKKQKNTWSTIKGVLLGVVGLCAVTAVGAFAVQAMPIQTTPNTPTTNTPVTPEPENPGNEMQYTNISFDLDNNACYIQQVDIYDAQLDSYSSVDITTGIENCQFVVGQRYMFYIHINSGYEATAVIYNNEYIWNYSCIGDNVFSAQFTVVESGVLQIVTQPISSGNENQSYSTYGIISSTYNGGSLPYTCTTNFVDASTGEIVDTLITGQEYRLELSVDETADVVIVEVRSLFGGIQCPGTASTSYTFTATYLDYTFGVAFWVVYTDSYNTTTVEVENMDCIDGFYITNGAGNVVTEVYSGGSYNFHFTVASSSEISGFDIYSGDNAIGSCYPVTPFVANSNYFVEFTASDVSSPIRIVLNANFIE